MRSSAHVTARAGRQPENAIPMKPFFGDATDDYLAQLAPLLEDIARRAVPDVRRSLLADARRRVYGDVSLAAHHLVNHLGDPWLISTSFLLRSFSDARLRLNGRPERASERMAAPCRAPLTRCARDGSVLKRCHLRGQFAQDAAAASSKAAGGRGKPRPAPKPAGPRSPPPSAQLPPMPDRRVSDLGLVREGRDSDWAPDEDWPGPAAARLGSGGGMCAAEGWRAAAAGDGGGASSGRVEGDADAPAARERHTALHRGLSDGAIPPPASAVPAAATGAQTTTAAAAAAAAMGARGEDVGLREGGLGWGRGAGEAEESALVAWSAVHGAFADVLRGMSPPASTLLPGSEDRPGPDSDT
jgi:hypothetical protein